MESSVFQAYPFNYPFYTAFTPKVSLDLFPLVLSLIENLKKGVEGEK